MARRLVRTLCRTLLVLGMAALQGCAYDPYTGVYVPCCTFPAYVSYPPYRYYPAPYAGTVILGGGWGWDGGRRRW